MTPPVGWLTGISKHNKSQTRLLISPNCSFFCLQYLRNGITYHPIAQANKIKVKWNNIRVAFDSSLSPQHIDPSTTSKDIQNTTISHHYLCSHQPSLSCLAWTSATASWLFFFYQYFLRSVFHRSARAVFLKVLTDHATPWLESPSRAARSLRGLDVALLLNSPPVLGLWPYIPAAAPVSLLFS